MNIAYCEDEKIQLEYMEQLIRRWADEGNDTVTYFWLWQLRMELLFEHPDSFPFDLLFWILIWTAWMACARKGDPEKRSKTSHRFFDEPQ